MTGQQQALQLIGAIHKLWRNKCLALQLLFLILSKGEGKFAYFGMHKLVLSLCAYWA
jgi:hypothetical protein